ncbi:hypothetical protein ACUN7V_12335 [Quadrisphaera oryzae]|uniref:hypothetical protein n=1 Tax=Quadrisphaera TaxID=317661 RepID=UPI001646523D|nr:hypothetical protein [Quadrisphaera sp. RL12-1S]MBC3761994.1 hypothetical protein [Quadrisphaera sp. RL12-1S]
MSPTTDGPRPRQTRWWSPLLVVHAALVVVVVVRALLVAAGIPAPDLPSPVWSGLDAVLLLLGAPWWALVVPVALALPLPEVAAQGLATGAPVLVNLLLHAVLLRAVRRHESRVERMRPGAGSPATAVRPASRSTQTGLAALAGGLVWAVWLGWDRTASYDVVTGAVQSPYVTLQVVGCALSVGVLTGVLATRWSPVAVAAGVSAGFLVCWTVLAAAVDDSGLYLVGALLLAVGLAAGTSLSAAVGRLVWKVRQHRPVS